MPQPLPDRCGLCCAPPLTTWWHPLHDLYRRLCGHHATDREPAMVDAGWLLLEDHRPGRPQLEPAATQQATH